MGDRSIFASSGAVVWAREQADAVFNSGPNSSGIKDIPPQAVHILLHHDLLSVEQEQTQAINRFAAAMEAEVAAIKQLASSIRNDNGGTDEPSPVRKVAQRVRNDGGWVGTVILGMLWALQSFGIIPPMAH